MIEPDFNQKQELARDLIRYYLSARRGLTELGILHSERNLQHDYAEWLVAELLDLQLNTNHLQKSGDATDRAGRTYQIRSRIIERLSPDSSFELENIIAPFDYVAGVFFSVELDVLGVVRIPREVVLELGTQTDGELRFACNQQTINHPRIEKIVWKPA